jgi:hypothetical protein
MPSIIDGSGSATFQTPLPLAQGGNGNTTGNVVSSQVAGAFNATGSAPLYACRAWVNFNGIGTVAIRASGNVSSITDNGTGDYTVNFATAMQDANYSITVGRSNAINNVNCNTNILYISSPVASSFRVGQFENGGLADITIQSFAIFR